MSDVAIFLGPTLDIISAQDLLDAAYLPPIKRGDLSELGPEIKTVGIIDGEFFQSLAVSPKEILRLLDRGITVYGASSMGALRAAEVHPHGMIGIGRIFEMYRDGQVDADDEVALTYDPDTYRKTSEPLINIRFALRAAVKQGLVQPPEADEVIAAIKAVYFPSRTFDLVTKALPKLKDYIIQQRPDQKRDDALLLLHTIARHIPSREELSSQVAGQTGSRPCLAYRQSACRRG